MSEIIYGVMVTGKDAKHEHLARQSVKSFIEQTYFNKKLLIINDGEYSLKDLNCNEVIEIKVNNSNKLLKLGGLRNVAFEYLNDGDIWVQWDDDDYRHPNLIQLQYDFLLSKKIDYCFLKSQILYDFNINHARIQHRPRGIIGTVMHRYDGKTKYDNISRAEDKLFKAHKGYSLDVSPFHYCRFLHKSNTWGFSHFYRTRRCRQVIKNFSNKWNIDGDSKKYLEQVLKYYKKD